MNTDNQIRERIFDIEKNYQVTTIVNEPAKISMKLDMPKLEEAILKGKNEDESKKKVRKRSSK